MKRILPAIRNKMRRLALAVGRGEVVVESREWWEGMRGMRGDKVSEVSEVSRVSEVCKVSKVSKAEWLGEKVSEVSKVSEVGKGGWLNGYMAKWIYGFMAKLFNGLIAKWLNCFIVKWLGGLKWYLFRPLPRNRVWIHGMGVVLVGVGIVVGSYLTISEVLLPRIRALVETSQSMPAEVVFNRGPIGELAGFLYDGERMLDPDALAIINAMVIIPSEERQGLINDTVLHLKDKGIWDKLDAVWFMAAHSQDAAVLNWKNPTGNHNLTPVNNPTFTADQGYQGDGTSSYLNTNWIPVTHGENYTLNDASFGVYSRTDLAQNDLVSGVWSGGRLYLNPRRSAGHTQFAINSPGTDSTTSTNNTLGLHLVRRTAVNSVTVIKNGSQISSSVRASESIPNGEIYLFADNQSGVARLFDIRQYAFAFTGGAMTEQQQADFYDIVQNYMTAIGAQVGDPVTLPAPTNPNSSVLSTEVRLAASPEWWDTDYQYKKLINLNNLSSTTLATSSAQITINTKQLADETKLQDNCEDLRVIYSASPTNHQEISRSIQTASGAGGATTCATSTATIVTFPLQESVQNASASAKYAIYYGNDQATTPSSAAAGFDLKRADNSQVAATLVCPFNGTTTCMGQEGVVTPTTESGAVRYSGGSALAFDGVNDYVELSTFEFTDLSVSAWVKTTSSSRHIVTNRHDNGNQGNWFTLTTSELSLRGSQSFSFNNSITDGEWHHVAFTKSGNNYTIYIDGEVDQQFTFEGSINQARPTSLARRWTANNSGFYQGILDEVAIYSRGLSSNEISDLFASPTDNKAADGLLGLYHFDENGTDPRHPGKAIDASGNGNHGTINGAKYVSGLVGVDKSVGADAQSSTIPNQSFASNQGIFIEEGTTNKVTNPSFNHTTYNTGWGANYLNQNTASSTFTPAVAKRNSAGPFAQGVMVGGGVDGSGTGDILSFPQGNQVSGVFRNNVDSRQGSIAFWITPEWNGNDGLRHQILFGNSSWFRVEKTASNTLRISDGASANVSVDISDWVAGSTYLVVIRWDSHNLINDVGKLCLSINNVNSCAFSSTVRLGEVSNTFYLGSDNTGAFPASAIIEGLTIYRRPLFDGTHGIDVGNGNEIAQIYNNGTGRDPTLVTGSWDVVFALPTDSQAGALITGTGNAWTHPHSSNLLYTSTTNTGGFMMNGNPETDGWIDHNSPDLVETLDTNEKIFAGGYRVGSDGFSEGVLGNPIFSDGTTSGWTAEGNGGIVSANLFSSSSHAFEFNGYGNARILQNNTGLSAGEYSMQVWYKHVEGHVPYFYLVDFSGTSIVTDFTTENSGEWQVAKVKFTATEGQKHVPIRYANNLPDDRRDGIVQIAGVKVEPGDQFTPIFDQGIKHTLSSQPVGRDYVVRAIAHSDGTSIPKIQIWDTINDHEITQLTGTASATRANPDVLLFTFELPYVSRYGGQTGYEWVEADSTEFEVRLLNTQESGTTYWHQVEVYENVKDNPSLEVGGGDGYWEPDGWNLSNMVEGETSRESNDFNSGKSSFRLNTNEDGDKLSTGNMAGAENFRSVGAFGKLISGSGIIFRSPSSAFAFQHSGAQVIVNYQGTDDWKHYPLVLRNSGSGGSRRLTLRGTGGINALYDDFYMLNLTPVSLTVTPASEANSTESTGLRVSGASTLTQPITGLSADSGVVKFRFTPRHSFGISHLFGFSSPGIISLYEDANNQIGLYRQDASTMRLAGVFNGTTVNADWTGPTLDAGVTYAVEIGYAAGGSLSLKIDGVEVASQTGVVAFGAVPSTAYFGSNAAGTNQYDATIADFEALTPSENTTSAYVRFGNKSARLVNAGSVADEYTIAINPASTATHTLSAFVYDGTSGNVGGAVSEAVARLVFNGVAVTPSAYTDMGGGWWRLVYSAATVNAEGLYGVQVLPGKTVYVDGVQLEQKAYATTYADGSLGTGYSWSGVAHESGSVRSGGDVRYGASNRISPQQGTVNLWVKSNKGHNFWQHNIFTPKYFFAAGGQNWQNGTITLYTYHGQLRLNVRNNDGSLYQISVGSFDQVASQDDWVNIVAVWEQDNVRLYANGVSVGTPITSATMPSSFVNNFLYIGNGNGSSPANLVNSDLRIFDSALTPDEVSQLYNQGLLTHTSSSESTERYNETGIYTSPTIDLSANGAWGSVPAVFTHALNNGGINYLTRTSRDNSEWTSWEAVSNIGGSNYEIASPAYRYMQWRADLTASENRSESPVITNLTLNYVEDATAPVNPVATALGYSNSSVAEPNLTSGGWANFAQPKFTWEAGVDEPGEGESASGVHGYYVLLTTNEAATPSANTGAGCYRFAQEGDREFVVGSKPASCAIADADYYLRVQTRDNAGNVSAPVTLFTYRYDGTPPRSPASVSSTTVGYTSENSFNFFWPQAADVGDHPSGIAYYEFKTGAEEGEFSQWQRTNEPGEPLVTEALEVTAYQEGQNFFFVRSVDFAGNVSAETSNLGVSPFYFNASAPTEPLDLVITPETSSESPADENVFSVAWERPAEFSGDIAKYYYCVNCEPSALTMTETTASETVNRQLTDMPLATRQGRNTFYLVAEDNNMNTQLGHGNRNFEAAASVDFWASTVAPGSPERVTITDASDRDAEIWRLTLAWRPSEEGGEPKHYVVWRSIDGEEYVEIGQTTSTAYTDADLEKGKRYYYKVKAVDNAGSSSLFSNVVSMVPEGKYALPPATGGVPSVQAGSTTAIVSWSTVRPAFGTVEYGPSTNYGSAATGTSATSDHRIRLSGLEPETTYHFRVQSLDDSGLVGYERSEAYSADYTFTTLEAPEISDVQVDDIGLNSAVISFVSSALESVTIDYGLSQEYGSSIQVATGGVEAGRYTARLVGLDHTSVYQFRIRGTDADGAVVISDNYSFETLTFPVITASLFQTDRNAGGTDVVVAFSTNVPTVSVVEYQAVRVDVGGVQSMQGTQGGLIVETDEGPRVNMAVLQDMSPGELAGLPIVPTGERETILGGRAARRHVQRITGLEDASMYVIVLRGQDQYGNEAVSEPFRYVTGLDTKPPVISNIVMETPMTGVGGSSRASMIVSFETDEPAYVRLLWGPGTGTEYPSATERDRSAGMQHVVVIRDLEPTSTYHFMIVAEDLAGNVAESHDMVVVTPNASQAAFDIIMENLERVFGFLVRR